MGQPLAVQQGAAQGVGNEGKGFAGGRQQHTRADHAYHHRGTAHHRSPRSTPAGDLDAGARTIRGALQHITVPRALLSTVLTTSTAPAVDSTTGIASTAPAAALAPSTTEATGQADTALSAATSDCAMALIGTPAPENNAQAAIKYVANWIFMTRPRFGLICVVQGLQSR